MQIERERELATCCWRVLHRGRRVGRRGGGSSSGGGDVGRRGSGSSSAGKRRRWRESSGRAPPSGEAKVQQLFGLLPLLAAAARAAAA